MPAMIERFSADEGSLDRTYPVSISPARVARIERFYSDTLAGLTELDFDGLSHQDQVDYLLLKNLVISDQHQLAIRKKQIDEMLPLLPYAKTIEDLMETKRLMQRPDAEKDAAALTEMVRQIKATQEKLDPKAKDGAPVQKPKVDPVVANRAVNATDELIDNLHKWFGQYNGYDPAFSWWVNQPYKDADEALAKYKDFLKEKLIGIKPDDKTTIIGDPVGRDALMNELSDNMISYTPEELIAIAQTEYDWCVGEMLKASREMGFGDNWHAAVEKVKQMHVAPGEQPELIRKLVVEGSDFVKQNQLVTVPPLADETWLMIMMTPKRQTGDSVFYRRKRNQRRLSDGHDDLRAAGNEHARQQYFVFPRRRFSRDDPRALPAVLYVGALSTLSAGLRYTVLDRRQRALVGDAFLGQGLRSHAGAASRGTCVADASLGANHFHHELPPRAMDPAAMRAVPHR